jgi:hypothetical protein
MNYMKIIISIENPTHQVILALDGVISAYDEQTSTAVDVVPNADAIVGQATESNDKEAQVSERPKRQRRTAHNDTSEQSQTRPEQDEQASEADPNQTTTSDAPTVVELRAKAQEVGTSSEAKKAIKALLDKFEAKSISSIPEEKRADFLAELDLI